MDESSVAGVRQADEGAEADVLEQTQSVGHGERRLVPDSGIEVPEADAYEQAIEVPFDEEDVR